MTRSLGRYFARLINLLFFVAAIATATGLVGWQTWTDIQRIGKRLLHFRFFYLSICIAWLFSPKWKANLITNQKSHTRIHVLGCIEFKMHCVRTMSNAWFCVTFLSMNVKTFVRAGFWSQASTVQQEWNWPDFVSKNGHSIRASDSKRLWPLWWPLRSYMRGCVLLSSSSFKSIVTNEERERKRHRLVYLHVVYW